MRLGGQLKSGDQRFFFWFLFLVDVNQRKIGRSIRDLVRLCYKSAMLRIHYDSSDSAHVVEPGFVAVVGRCEALAQAVNIAPIDVRFA